MSFDLTRKHLKTDLTKRAIIDQSLDQKEKQQPQKKKTLTKKGKSQTTRKTKSHAQIAQGAARPRAKKAEFNPFIKAVDEGRGSIKSIQKQIRAASGSLDHNASEVFFAADENAFNSTAQRKSTGSLGKAAAKRGISTKAMMNLQFLTRASLPENKEKTKKDPAKKYAARIKADTKKNKNRRWAVVIVTRVEYETTPLVEPSSCCVLHSSSFE